MTNQPEHTKLGAKFLDVDGDIMRVQQVIGSESFGIKFASTYREFPNAQAPAVALAILTAAGLIKPAGVVAEDTKQDYRRQTIDGENFSANADPEFWADAVDRTMAAFIREAQYLTRSTAVRDYFADETARATESAEQELTRRRDELARELIPVDDATYALALPAIQRAIDMLIRLQDEAKK